MVNFLCENEKQKPMTQGHQYDRSFLQLSFYRYINFCEKKDSTKVKSYKIRLLRSAYIVSLYNLII